MCDLNSPHYVVIKPTIKPHSVCHGCIKSLSMQEIQSSYALNLAITNSGLQLRSMSREDQTYVPQVDGIFAFGVAALPESPTERQGCYQHYTQHASSRYLIASRYSVSLLIWSCRPRVENTSVWHILLLFVVFCLGVSSTSYTRGHIHPRLLLHLLGTRFVSKVTSPPSRTLEFTRSENTPSRFHVARQLPFLQRSNNCFRNTTEKEKVFTIECFYMCICIHLNKCPCAW